MIGKLDRSVSTRDIQSLITDTYEFLDVEIIVTATNARWERELYSYQRACSYTRSGRGYIRNTVGVAKRRVQKVIT